MANLVEIIVTAKDLASPVLARSAADMTRLQANAARQSAAAAAASDRTRALQLERDRLAAAERASVARKAAGEITAAERAAEKEQIASARAVNAQQIRDARTAEREQVAAARRASTQVAAAQREQAAAARASAARMKDAFGAVALGAAAVGVESIKMASKFDSAMTLLHTQAGVAQDKMAGLEAGVLALAGKVGQDPDSLAESLYHVESNFESMGISSSKALRLTETAAKGATTGHADLVDVTNALTAAVASNIPGVQNFDKAMGVLNATVGVGDMKMQDLASAFGSGMIATVKGFGLSIQDVGAALAVFGDNNIRGSLAGNQLRMSVMALGKPVATAHEALKKLGLTTTTLSKDMQKGGLKLALTDLIDRMKKAGVTGKEQGQLITDLFGRKAGSGLNILVDQFDRLKSKYPALEEGANKFGKSWTDTTKTFAFQMKQLQGEFDSFMIKLGEKLIPYVEKFVQFMKGPFADAVGPVAKEAFKILTTAGGSAFKALGAGLKIAAPFLKDLAAGMDGVLEAAAPFAKELGKAGEAILNAVIPSNKLNQMELPFARLRDEVRANKGEFEEAARVMANAIIDMAQIAITSLPLVTKSFRLVATGVLDMVGVMVDGAAQAFGWVPGLGGKLKNAAKEFDTFKDSVISGMGKADSAAQSFAKSALPKLAAGKLKLNIDNWEAQISAAKSKLKSVPASKRADLEARIKDLQDKVDAAKHKLGEIDGSTARAKVEANVQPFFGAYAKVKGAKIPTKTGNITANTRGFWAGVNSLIGRVLGTSYVNVAYRKTESNLQPPFHAAGGPIHLAGGGSPDGGGRITGPGSGTSDSIPAMLSNGEYVVRAASVQKYGERFLDAVNSGTLKVAAFASGGKAKGMSQATKDARHELDSSFGISYFGRQAGYHRTPFEHGLGAPTDINALVDSLNHAAGLIKKAFSGKTESSLLKHLNSVGKSLISHEKALAKVTASLDKAKDKLNSLKDSASQLSDSVKSNLISSANITKAAGNTDGGTLTLNAVKTQMTMSRDKVLAFANALKQLKAKGYSKTIIQQVAEAGIDGGGLETAGALLQASASEVSSMNATQAQIESAAGSAGKTTASAVYDAAIKYQAKVVDKLTKQQASLEKTMANLAKSMEKLLQKALGHKASGGIVGAAASGGLRGGLTWVGEHEPELLDLPVGSRVWSGPDSRRKWAEAQTPWASMLTTPRRAHHTAAAPASARQEPIVLELRSSGSHVDELLLQILRKAIRVRGGNVQLVLAGRPA
jgi:TP901 family phage tail tape measure protein